MTVSENIFLILKEQGLNQKQFSQMTGIAESTISDWKTKGLNPTAEKIPIICKALDISYDQLFGQSMVSYDIILSQDEKILIEKYRNSDDDTKKRIREYL